MVRELLTLGSLLLQRPSHGEYRLCRRIPRSNGQANDRSRKILVYMDDSIIIGDSAFEIYMKDVK